MSGGDWKAMYEAARDGDGELVAHYARAGIDLDHMHPEVQGTALVMALVAGHEDVAHTLLDHGASPTLYSDFDELTPLQAARAAGLAGIVERLLAAGA
ncbi:MAG: ankyrin repeat domain-containing protein [Nocardioides sp.]|uniref:ankyrin repeat domain-containing protein n=1 Tax=Nocardioides sp. TaxID=35761 RepID=UPI003F06492A